MRKCYFCRIEIDEKGWACDECNSDEAFQARQSGDKSYGGIYWGGDEFGKGYKHHLQKRAKLAELHKQGKLPKHLYSVDRNGKPYLSPKKLRGMRDFN